MTKGTSDRTEGEWHGLRLRLMASSEAPEWQHAPEWIRDRLDRRFLEPARRVLHDDAMQGEGFTVTAIDCILIEFLAALRGGLVYRYRESDKARAPHEYGSSRTLIMGFLTGLDPYRESFDRKLAAEFYENVRCGLLHEAATKGGWRIRASDIGPLVHHDGGNPILNRRKLHSALCQTVDKYCEELPRSQTLQQGFLRTMDNIFAVERVYVFAYGSNMDEAQLRSRIGSPPHWWTVGKVSKRRFSYCKPGKDGTMKANMVKHPSDAVEGVVYEMDRDALQRLGEYEGGYQPQRVDVKTGTHTFAARSFVSDRHEIGSPSPDYVEHVVGGARAHRLSEEYIARVLEPSGRGP